MSDPVNVQPETAQEKAGEKKLITLKKLDTRKAKLLIGGQNRS
jgi:hypothetical protein